ncbi:MAG TPA: hypothetical protein VFZ91_16390 [Allosphingosinicella sp.]
MAYEAEGRDIAEKLAQEHGRLLEARLGAPIVLVFERGEWRVPGNFIFKFGYYGSGPSCFHAFLKASGFPVSLAQIESAKSGDVLTAHGRSEPARPMPSSPSREVPRAVGFRFDIGKIDSGSYGDECWKTFWRVADGKLPAGAVLREGDTKASMDGKENVFCISLEHADPDVVAQLREAMLEDAGFRDLSATPPVADGADCLAEPLVQSGRIDSRGDLVGDAYNAGPALKAVRAENIGESRPAPASIAQPVIAPLPPVASESTSDPLPAAQPGATAQFEAIELAYLKRLFGWGGLTCLWFGVFCVAFATLVGTDDNLGFEWALMIGALGVMSAMAGLPRLGVTSGFALGLVGVLDWPLSVFLRLISLPLAFFAGIGLVTFMVGIRMANSGNWLRAHAGRFAELAGKGLADQVARIAGGALGTDEDGFWAVEGDKGPFWIIRRDGDGAFLTRDDGAVRRLSAGETRNIDLVPRPFWGFEPLDKRLKAYPQEHALVIPPASGDPDPLTLFVEADAAWMFATRFRPNDRDVLTAAARTSALAEASAWLSLFGVGGILGVAALVQIARSGGRLRGRGWAWMAVVIGGGLLAGAGYLLATNLSGHG